MVKQKNSQQSKEKIIPKNKPVETLDDKEIFTLNTEPNPDIKLLRNKRKNKEIRSKKKTKNQEERKIKRIENHIKVTGSVEDKTNIKKEENLYDLWEGNNRSTGLIKLEPIKYPKVIIPHPGQSYNPNREDLKNLLQTIVEINQPKIIEEPKPSLLTQAPAKSIHPEFNEVDREDQKVSNNPPINDTDRLPRRIRNKLHASKLNKQINKEQESKKRQKKVISEVKVFRNFNKQVEINKKKQNEIRKKKEDEINKQKELINVGVYYKDTDVLDYKINKKGVTLKNLTSDKSLISDRYENILKRNIIGETSVKKKRNRKLNKIQYRENQDFFFDEGDQNLKIIN